MKRLCWSASPSATRPWLVSGREQLQTIFTVISVSLCGAILFSFLINIKHKLLLLFHGDQIEHAHDNPVDEITLGESDMMPTTLSDEMPSEKLVTPKRMNLDVDKEPAVKCEVEKDFQAEGKKAKKKEGKKEKAKRENTQSYTLYNNVDGCSFISACLQPRGSLTNDSHSSLWFSEMDQNEEKETEKEKDKEKKPKKKDKGKDSEDPQKTNKTAKQERKSKIALTRQYSLQDIHNKHLYYITIVYTILWHLYNKFYCI